MTQEAPFKIEIVEPKVPLVRDGSMDLKVVATRKEGFTAPITVQMLYNPPGVGSSGSIAIPEGQTEAVIPLTANGGAEVEQVEDRRAGRRHGRRRPDDRSPRRWPTLEVSEPFFAFTFQAAAAEQGKATDVVIKVDKKKDFEGPAKVELLGLPNEVTTEPREITKDSTELVFPVKTTANSPAGKHKTVICRAVIMANGEPITHTLGTGELRIDTPLAAQARRAGRRAAPRRCRRRPRPMPPPEKRLSRLEQAAAGARTSQEAAKAEASAAVRRRRS